MGQPLRGAASLLCLAAACAPWLGGAQAAAQASSENASEALETPPDDSTGPSSEDDRRARELFVLGDRLYEEGRYEASVTSFAEAYRLSGRPLLLFNLANAEERLGRLQDAAEHLRAYLPDAPDDEREAVTTRIERLGERIDAARRAEDQHGHETPPDETPPVVVEPSRPDDSSRPLRRAGVTFVSVGGVGVGTAVVFALLAQGARNDARAACARVNGARVCSAAARGPLRLDRRYSLVADIGLGVGLAAAITGLVLLLRGRHTREAPPAVVPEAVVTRTRVELRLHARF